MNGTNGSMAFDWSWIVALLIIAGIFGNGFGGFGGNNAGLTEEFLDNRLMARDTFNVNTNLLDTKYALGTEIMENRYQAQVGDCGLSKEIMQNRYDNALQTQTLSAQMAECCCNLRAEGLANTQKVIDLIQQDKIQQLRDQVYTTNLSLNNANLANQIISTVRPFPTPSYVVSSPYTSLYNPYNGCGCGNSTII